MSVLVSRLINPKHIQILLMLFADLDQVQAIQDGLDDLSRASCVKFTPYKKGDRDAVVIQVNYTL